MKLHKQIINLISSDRLILTFVPKESKQHIPIQLQWKNQRPSGKTINQMCKFQIETPSFHKYLKTISRTPHHPDQDNWEMDIDNHNQAI